MRKNFYMLAALVAAGTFVACGNDGDDDDGGNGGNAGSSTRGDGTGGATDATGGSSNDGSGGDTAAAGAGGETVTTEPELICDDGLDNNDDSLTDCADSTCDEAVCNAGTVELKPSLEYSQSLGTSCTGEVCDATELTSEAVVEVFTGGGSGVWGGRRYVMGFELPEGLQGVTATLHANAETSASLSQISSLDDSTPNTSLASGATIAHDVTDLLELGGTTYFVLSSSASGNRDVYTTWAADADSRPYLELEYEATCSQSACTPATSVEANCGNGADDDGDELIDCADPSCDSKVCADVETTVAPGAEYSQAVGSSCTDEVCDPVAVTTDATVALTMGGGSGNWGGTRFLMEYTLPAGIAISEATLNVTGTSSMSVYKIADANDASSGTVIATGTTIAADVAEILEPGTTNYFIVKEKSGGTVSTTNDVEAKRPSLDITYSALCASSACPSL